MSEHSEYMPPSPIPTATASEERLRELGLQLVTMLSAVIRIGRAYSVKNQVFRTQIDAILQTLRTILEGSPEVALVALDNDFYLNGVRVPVSASNFRFHTTVAEIMRLRGISGFRAVPGVDVEDLSRFFEIFLGQTPLRGAALVKACEAANIRHLTPAVHASTSPVDESGGTDWDGEGEPGGDGPRTTGGGGGRGSAGWRGAVRKYYSAALQGARSLLTTTSLTSGLEMRHAKRVVQPLVDGAFASEPVVVGLATLHEHDEFTYSHAVNVCAVAVTMGHVLGMDRRTLADLGVAALLHDVGKAAVAEAIVHPLEAFTDEERAAAERHPIEGAKLLARTTALNSTTLRCMRVALEHHLDASGDSGYPALGEGWQPSLLSGIVSVADCFVNLHTRRGDLVENITPYQALGMMLGPYCHRFEPALLWALLQSVGFYPPGQVVELNDGTLAAVLAPNKHDLSRPHVRVIAGSDHKLCPPEQARELHPLPSTMSVVRALRGDEYPTEVAEAASDAVATLEPSETAEVENAATATPESSETVEAASDTGATEPIETVEVASDGGAMPEPTEVAEVAIDTGATPEPTEVAEVAIDTGATPEPTEVAEVAIDTGATAEPTEVAEVATDTGATVEPTEVAEVAIDTGATVEPTEVAEVAIDTGAMPEPTEVAEVASDAGATPEPIEVTEIASDAGAQPEPIEVTEVASDTGVTLEPPSLTENGGAIGVTPEPPGMAQAESDAVATPALSDTAEAASATTEHVDNAEADGHAAATPEPTDTAKPAKDDADMRYGRGRRRVRSRR